jgi:hypothetical protein
MGREITEVESGIPITLYRPEAVDGERHWFTYSLDNVPGNLLARDLWTWWTEHGRPTWRYASQAKADIRRFIVTEDVAA